MTKRFEFEIEAGRRSDDHGLVRWQVWELDVDGSRHASVASGFGSRWSATMEFERVARQAFDEADEAASTIAPVEALVVIEEPPPAAEVAS